MIEDLVEDELGRRERSGSSLVGESERELGEHYQGSRIRHRPYSYEFRIRIRTIFFCPAR